MPGIRTTGHWGIVIELLGANTEVLDRSAESLSTDARRVQDIRLLVARALAELQAGWNGTDLDKLVQLWEQQGSPLLAEASAALELCGTQLRAQSAAQRAASSWTGGDTPATPLPTAVPIPASMPAPAPPHQGSPAENAAWWSSLSPQDKQRVIREHPDWIGNRDGVSFAARDLANRALLSVDQGHLVAERTRQEALLAGEWCGGIVTNNGDALDHVINKLASVTAIEAILAQPGERQLLLLDVAPERAQAAIASGNADTADNVAVFVPGLGSTVGHSMKDYDKAMNQLRQRAESESKDARPGQIPTTAAVAWIGYQAPQLGLDLLNPARSVAFADVARKGANALVPFLQGVGAARQHDAHLTLLGHSYGSTTAGLALQKATGVDDAVFFGSPGIGTDHLEDLSLAPGHAYYIEARLDPVGDLGTFGADPSHLSGIKHESARESVVVDPATGRPGRLSEVTGHTAYLLDHSTSQHNMSVVVAGLPERLVSDSGEGLGDVLSWALEQ
jgi:hypothetical protein